MQEDYSSVWEFEKELTDFTGVAVTLNMFITNDYRMGFIIEDSLGQVHWLVTHRNWGGMASPAERISTGISDISFEVLPVAKQNAYFSENINTGITDISFNVAKPIYPELLSISNDDQWTIRLLFNHLIDYDLSTVKSAFNVRDSANVIFTVVSTSPGVDNSELILTITNFNGAFGNIFVTYDRNIIELDSINDGSRFALESFTAEFTPELVPIEGFFTENIGTSVGDISFEVKRVYYNNRYESENIETGITDINFIVTQVGSSPL